MALASLPRPDLAAHREALKLPPPVLVKELVALIGRKLTAYVGGAKDVREVDRWMAGTDPGADAEQRLRLTFQLARMLSEHDGAETAQAWLIGLNPELGDRSPLRLLKEGELNKVGQAITDAARNFLGCG